MGRKEALAEVEKLEMARRQKLAQEIGCSPESVSFRSVNKAAEIALDHLKKVTERKFWADNLAPTLGPNFPTAGESLGLVQRDLEKPVLLIPTPLGLQILKILADT